MSDPTRLHQTIFLAAWRVARILGLEWRAISPLKNRPFLSLT